MTAERPVQGRTFLDYLPSAVREPRRPAVAILVGWLCAIIPSLALSAAAQWLAPNVERPEFAVQGATALIMLAAIAPIMETLIMGGVLLILLRFLSPAWAVALSAVGWGVAHSLAAPVWGLVIWWPFLIFSTLFVTWRARSLAAAFAVPAAVHALQNLGPALLIASGQAG